MQEEAVGQAQPGERIGGETAFVLTAESGISAKAASPQR
jgi:hypothetical protein